MGISERYTYYWTIFAGLPFGIACFIAGIYLFFSTPSEVKDLNIYKGKIKDYGVKEVYHEQIDAKGDVFFIKLRHDLEFYTDLAKHRTLLINFFNEKKLIDHNAIIWTEKNEKYIEQLSVDNKVVLEYTPPYWNAWIFFIAGIIITTGAIFYLKKNVGDIKAERGLLGRILFGKKKRR
jgi:hypothetical protein